ncbi:MAG: hypothetical protein K8S62_04350 [Candidatus Sabulitectum sp.]|nr:hypothetical protein [Candidatus Sabulitectum sp.]
MLTLVPHILTWLFGLYDLKLNPVLLLGAMTGAGTCTAALNSVKENCGNPLPVIGYTVPYAMGNVLLAVMGALVVNIILYEPLIVFNNSDMYLTICFSLDSPSHYL